MLVTAWRGVWAIAVRRPVWRTGKRKGNKCRTHRLSYQLTYKIFCSLPKQDLNLRPPD